MFGGIEAGGTKFVCGVGTNPENLRTAQFPTSVPDLTLKNVIEFFRREAGSSLSAVGIGSFGPVDLDQTSSTYGYITSTPKAGWNNYDLVGAVEKALGVPVGFDTDVNAAVLGEARWGAAQGLSDAVYLTVGTGIGGGALVNGRVIHGLVHSEMGHLRIPHNFVKDPFPGLCPYHGDCLEGLAAGPAMQARWSMPSGVMPADHKGWELEAHYLGLGLVNIALTLSPRRILLGGGVMQQHHLFALVRREFTGILNNYVRHAEILENMDQYIRPPLLSGRAGVLGALVLAEQASTAVTAGNTPK